ncbi:homoserine kinase [Acidobacteria bacterium AB60]|nr:homoserine kinase [Acidobacteria bacterium AB60]
MNGCAQSPGKMRLRLPATSANLGPGFDTAAVALNLYLHIEAQAASEFSIRAKGRDAERCGRLDNNLILDLYRTLLEENGRPVVPLAIEMENEIPLGMGCGSSAAGRLAAITLANHFGSLNWDSDQILAKASALEGHPDNAAACWLGGFVAAASKAAHVSVARVVPPAEWRPIVVLPNEPLATSKARAVLPETYARADVVANLQSVAMLGLAFAQGRGDLLQASMSDRIHQPYRSGICPQLPRLLPLAGLEGILGVALSGAGPAVLVVVDGQHQVGRATCAIEEALEGMSAPELLVCCFEARGANRFDPLEPT